MSARDWDSREAQSWSTVPAGHYSSQESWESSCQVSAKRRCSFASYQWVKRVELPSEAHLKVAMAVAEWSPFWLSFTDGSGEQSCSRSEARLG